MGQEQLYVVLVVFGIYGIWFLFKYALAAVIRFVGREARKGWKDE